MSVLQRQLFVVFTGKQVMTQIKQVVKPWYQTGRRLSKENKGIRKANRMRAREDWFPLMIENPIEAERLRQPYTSNFDDFKEMSIQVISRSSTTVCFQIIGNLETMRD